jgi:hypothetical protein
MKYFLFHLRYNIEISMYILLKKYIRNNKEKNGFAIAKI